MLKKLYLQKTKTCPLAEVIYLFMCSEVFCGLVEPLSWLSDSKHSSKPSVHPSQPIYAGIIPLSFFHADIILFALYVGGSANCCSGGLLSKIVGLVVDMAGLPVVCILSVWRNRGN